MNDERLITGDPQIEDAAFVIPRGRLSSALVIWLHC